MNLTIEQLAKATKLSVSTLRVYASQRDLGKKVGNRRVFTQADVQTLLKGSRKPPRKNGTKAPVKKANRKAAKPEFDAATKPKPVDVVSKPVVAKPLKPSFWNRVFGGTRSQKKISLMDVRTNK